jgi:hypothetical protein
MNKWVSVGISALSDFVITAGGAFMAIGGNTWPTSYQLAICGVAGLLQAARGVQKILSVPPQ